MKNKGSLLILTGSLLIFFSFLLIIYNVKESTQAEKNVVKTVEKLALELPETAKEPFVMPQIEMPEIEIDGNTYIGVLKLPSLSQELPVMSGWSYPKLKLAPCRYQGSAYEKDLIIMAHNYPAHFGSLKELSVGETVTFTDVDGNIFYYEVAELEILDPFQTEAMEAGEWDLTLFTCTLGGQRRVTVRCLQKE